MWNQSVHVFHYLPLLACNPIPPGNPAALIRKSRLPQQKPRGTGRTISFLMTGFTVSCKG